jgi:hypothetical protein
MKVKEMYQHGISFKLVNDFIKKSRQLHTFCKTFQHYNNNMHFQSFYREFIFGRVFALSIELAVLAPTYQI